MVRAAPDYDAYQGAFHEAFRAELYGILDTLPIPSGGHVLDVPCGDGFYSRRLVERLGPGERLTAVDVSEGSLGRTRKAVAGTRPHVVVQNADAYNLPFEDAALDLVWCAQSLISLDPLRALREMFRVVKRDGVVAILEVDEFHHVLLPWPGELEAALPSAVHAASVQKYGDGVKLAPTRKLRGIFGRAGFQAVHRVTYSFDRAAPFDRPTTTFLTRHLEHLRSFAYPFLPSGLQAVFDRTTDPDADNSLYHLPDAELICINAVYHARPSNDSGE